MNPLFVLFGAFLLSLLGTKLFLNNVDVGLSGKIALSVMLIFTAIGHFKFTKGMAMMLPAFVPIKTGIIYITGILEIIAAAGIFIPELKNLTGILLIIFFILILPANIYASVKHLNYETGNFEGKGTSYLWFRIPFQILLIVWTYYFVVR